MSSFSLLRVFIFAISTSSALAVSVTSNVVAPATGATVPVFTLDCGLYPDICDNTCAAVHCFGFNDPTQYLHYDPKSGSDQPNPKTKQTAADLRRAAIGCKASVEGKSNYCQVVAPGSQCDEFPYASTYDGGLGCIEARYTGADRLQSAGTTRCSSGTQNGAHGNELNAFYSAHGLGDGSRFQIGFNPLNVDKAPLCKLLRADTSAAALDLNCPSTSSGNYRHISTPAADSYCPPRGRYRKRMPSQDLSFADRNATMHVVQLEDGSSIEIPHGPRPQSGELVSRFQDGEIVHVRVV